MAPVVLDTDVASLIITEPLPASLTAKLTGRQEVWRTFEAPVPSLDGYRVIWVHSTGKAARAARIEAGLATIDTLQTRLHSDRKMTPAPVLAAYRYQPSLERRNHILKGPQQVAPVYLETAHRIEAQTPSRSASAAAARAPTATA